MSIELGQRLHASRECDEIAPKETVPKEAVSVRVNSWPKVLACLAFAVKHSIVKSKHLGIVKSIHKQVDSSFFSALSALLAVLSLGIEYFRLITAGTPFDSLLEILLVFSLAVFGVEFLVRCAAEEDYCCSAWFPLDLLATLTLLMEMRWFQYFTFNEDHTMLSSSADHYAHIGGQGANALQFLRAARSARVLQILRLARLIKLYRLGFGLVARSREWFPFWYLRDKTIPVHDSVATKRPFAEAEWSQGVFQV